MTGSSSLELYNPTEIVKLGRVIFVSMQYRVGAHGFLYFGQESSAPGNVGLLDQVIIMLIRDLARIKSQGGQRPQIFQMLLLKSKNSLFVAFS